MCRLWHCSGIMAGHPAGRRRRRLNVDLVSTDYGGGSVGTRIHVWTLGWLALSKYLCQLAKYGSIVVHRYQSLSESFAIISLNVLDIAIIIGWCDYKMLLILLLTSFKFHIAGTSFRGRCDKGERDKGAS